MAGKIIADTIESAGSQITLNVGNVTILTASSTGLTLTPTNNVNINVANSNVTFTTANITGTATFAAGAVGTPSITTTGDTNTGIFFSAADTIDFTEGGTATGQFDSSGNFLFNSGYGSVAVAYGCRAWVSFNGTGTVAIRASGNVSSITDNGIGDYTVNFTTAMPDVNFATTALLSSDSVTPNYAYLQGTTGAATTSSVRVQTSTNGGSSVDRTTVCISIFR